MSETTANPKFACPSCGGDTKWDPAKQALVCPYCGTVAATESPKAAEIREYDLLATLQAIPEEMRGWKVERTSVKCQSCQAISVFDPVRVGQRCDFCGSVALIPLEEMTAPIRPESLLEFKLDEAKVRDLVRRWYADRWFAPNTLGERALTDTLRGIYIPYWTFDAQVQADWRALSGYYYYETEVYTDDEGRQQTRSIQHTRWEPSWGSVAHAFDDALEAASKGVDAELLRKIEPFPTTTDLKPYEPSFLAGWVVEQYQVDLETAAQKAHEEMLEEVREACRAQVPGDTHTDLTVNAKFSGQTFKHVLVPVWLVSYNYGAKTFQVVVNGYTGAIAGKHPLSWAKILLVAICVLLAILVLLLFGSIWMAASRH